MLTLVISEPRGNIAQFGGLHAVTGVMAPLRRLRELSGPERSLPFSAFTFLIIFYAPLLPFKTANK